MQSFLNARTWTHFSLWRGLGGGSCVFTTKVSPSVATAPAAARGCCSCSLHKERVGGDYRPGRAKKKKRRRLEPPVYRFTRALVSEPLTAVKSGVWMTWLIDFYFSGNQTPLQVCTSSSTHPAFTSSSAWRVAGQNTCGVALQRASEVRLKCTASTPLSPATQVGQAMPLAGAFQPQVLFGKPRYTRGLFILEGLKTVKTHFPDGTRTLHAISRRRNLRSCDQRVLAA